MVVKEPASHFTILRGNLKQIKKHYTGHSKPALPSLNVKQRLFYTTLARLLLIIALAPSCTQKVTHLLLIEIQGRDRLLKISREEQIISKQETTRELVRGLAHEIKNPLGGIRGAAQLLSRTVPDNSLDEYTNIIIEEADRLRDLVDRLLGSNQLPKQEATNIHEVLERVCQLVAVEQVGSLHIVRDYDPSIPEFISDKSQLIQATLNICRNAVQAMVESETVKPTLKLKTRTKSQFTIGNQRHRLVAHITIEDNGPGIPAQLKDNLFYPMVSGRAAGTGLGLSIAQSLINQHNGIIEYDSEAGRTAFSIYLPLKLA